MVWIAAEERGQKCVRVFGMSDDDDAHRDTV